MSKKKPEMKSELQEAIGKRICENISAEIREKGIDCEEIAKVAGISKKTMERIMKSERCPKTATFYRLATALGQKMEYFLKKR